MDRLVLSTFITTVALVLDELNRCKRGPIDHHLQQRNEYGAFSTTFKPFYFDSNPRHLKEYIRMSPANFNKLLTLVSPFVQPLSIYGRPPIPLDMKLAVTLRFLAAGESQRSIAIQYKLSKSVVHKILNGMLPAIYDALVSKYLAPPNTEVITLRITNFV